MKNNYLMTCTTFVVFLFLLRPTSTNAQTPPAPPAGPTPTPAPAPAPEYVNLTDLLSVAGPFSIFLDRLQATKVIDTLQNQANNSREGITIFVPKNQAFSSTRRPISNLTQDQLKSLLLFHALPRYYPLSEFTGLSRHNPVATLAGADLYALNFTDTSGTIRISSGWTVTKVSSAVHAADPVALYQVDSVLLPEAIFGTDIPPTPAPAPAPEIAPAADDQRVRGSGGGGGGSSPPTSAPSAAPARMGLSSWAAAVGLLLLGWF
ncbi:fasciclin-like arabinogalactan protein 7 [Phtheirospermum japonicum]|uniref:Fasciclin-like arabinogalactan protein 7 n=1 Tax=Phtheirospermum japonicum TaxID=374723 RepID=A0A830BLY6_9LAMI|nr:fasciclin-like arabinogalactan protein 7 [Phtheirospermum japonicum]